MIDYLANLGFNSELAYILEALSKEKENILRDNWINSLNNLNIVDNKIELETDNNIDNDKKDV